MHLVDVLHQNGIGVVLDWVPSHFPWDPHGLGFFDGTHLYEHLTRGKATIRTGRARSSTTAGNEVRVFYPRARISGSRTTTPTGSRGRRGVHALPRLRPQARRMDPEPPRRPREPRGDRFLRFLNETVYRDFPDVQTIAEESTAWPQVSRPTYVGGLGFGMKWNMGWMHDTLGYFKRDPVYRKHHHDELTFSLWYAFHENFVLPLSHDEVVHGKACSSAACRATPGSSSPICGCSATCGPTRGRSSSSWAASSASGASGRTRTASNGTCSGSIRATRACSAGSRISTGVCRRAFSPCERFLAGGLPLGSARRLGSERAVLPEAGARQRAGARGVQFHAGAAAQLPVGVPQGGRWREILNSDAEYYGGSGAGNYGGADAQPMPYEEYSQSLTLTLPPLAMLVFKPE